MALVLELLAVALLPRAPQFPPYPPARHWAAWLAIAMACRLAIGRIRNDWKMDLASESHLHWAQCLPM